MSTIYCVVLLKNLQKKLVIDSNWVSASANANEFNFGLRPHALRKIFYSPERKDANFDLPVQNEFDETVDACYLGYLLRSYSKYAIFFTSKINLRL